MKKNIISTIFAMLLFFVLAETAHASEIDSGFEYLVIEDNEVYMDLEIGKDNYSEVSFEDEDGVEATISLELLLPEYNLITILTDRGGGGSSGGGGGLTPGRSYLYRYEKGRNEKYSYIIKVDGSPLRIVSLSNLQFDWYHGTVKSWSAKKLTNTTGRTQFIYDRTAGTIKGSATETSDVRLYATGRGGSHHLEITRNMKTKYRLSN